MRATICNSYFEILKERLRRKGHTGGDEADLSTRSAPRMLGHAIAYWARREQRRTDRGLRTSPRIPMMGSWDEDLTTPLGPWRLEELRTSWGDACIHEWRIEHF